MKNIFYEKRGRRYFPVREYDSVLMDVMPKGFHLTHVYPGGKSIRYHVDPDVITITATLMMISSKLSTLIYDASKLQPVTPSLTTYQKELFDKFMDSLTPDQGHYISYGSANDLSDKILNIIVEQSKELLNDPKNKELFDEMTASWKQLLFLDKLAS